MKKTKLAAMGLSTIVLVQLAVFFGSCQKEASLTKTEAVEEIITQSVNSKANALPHTKQYPSDVAAAWFDLLTVITKNKPYNTAQSSRILTYTGLALYESVVPGMPSYQSMYKYFTGNSIEVDNKKEYFWPACANAAIARIASRIMQNYPTPNVAQVQALETSLNASFQSSATPAQLQVSNEFGRWVADIIYDYSRTDGTFNPDGSFAVCPPYVPLGGPGNWVPTPPLFLPAVGQCIGDIRTFIPDIVNTVLASPHPIYSSDPATPFYQAANEVYQRRNNITSQEMRVFSNWRDLAPNYNPLAHMLKLSTEIIIKEKLNLEDAAVLFGKQTVAMFDAIAAAFKSKFHYSLIRPVTYIRGVIGANSWVAFGTTPQTPSYPDELSVTAAQVDILESYFGTNYAITDSVHQSTHGSFSYSSLNALLLDVVEARVSGGTSFRFGGEAGIVQGRAIGELVESLPFKKP